MKLKDIFLVFVLGAIWGFSSCSSEEIIDSPENGEATLSISLSVNDTQTKAGEQIATSEELRINNCHVSMFDMNGDFLTSFDFPDEGVTLSTDAKGVCVLASNKTIRTFGKERTVKFLAIANMDNEENWETTAFRGKTTYEDYLKAVVTSTSLSENNLVKVGEISNVQLTNGANNISISIPLTQLTARIDFDGIVTKGDVADKTLRSATDISLIEGTFMDESDLRETGVKEIFEGNKSEFSSEIGKRADWWTDDDGVYGFGFNKSYYYKSRFVGVCFTKTVVSSDARDFEIVKIEGFNKKSNIGIWNVESLENEEYEALSGNIQKNTFYTYGVGEKNKTLTVCRNISSSKKTYVAYGFIRQNRSSSWNSFSPVPNANDYSGIPIYDLNGNKHEDADKFSNLIWTEVNAEETKASDEVESYTFDLTDYAFIQGNRYKIQGTYMPEVGIKWTVEGMTIVPEVNIPSFE